MSAGALSALLLDLYRYSRDLPLSEFQGQTLRRLQRDLPFDSAWWGVAAKDHQIYSSFPFGLPTDYARFYRNRVSETDTLAEAAIAALGDAVRFGPCEFADSPGLSHLTRSFGIQQALCAVLVTPTLNLVMFVSLYRHGREPAFQESEREFCHWLAPHLWATWTANWIAHLQDIRAHSASPRVSHAIADQRAVLHSAEPRFVELVRAEWPNWQGPALPLPLRRCLETRREYCGSAVVLRCSQANGLTLVEAREHSALDTLSPRERTIAAAFGEGQSYKRIAADLGLSPATVRHYLRRIYAKANISNKSELTQLVGSAAAAVPPWREARAATLATIEI